MKIQISIGHPAHVHLFKNTVWNLEKKGHKIKIVARDKEVTTSLLDNYGFEYELFPKYRYRLLSKAIDRPLVYNIFYKIARDFKPDILTGCGGNVVTFIGKVIGKPSIVFTDTEHAKIANKLTFPFATVICTPSCFKKDIGKKQVRYNGYHELAYLHPNYFKPDLSVFDDLGLSKDDKFIILRSVSWGASHDTGDRGFTNKEEVVKSLERFGQVLITSEKKLPPELEKYEIRVSPEKIHHLLYFANLYIGESATMASESAMLGTPSIFVSTSRRGYTDELESRYGLVYTFSDPKTMNKYALEKAFELLEDEDVKKKWGVKRIKMLSEKIDVTKFIVNLIENYPECLNNLERKGEPHD